MMVWSSVFQHQFLDGNPANLTAVPGQLTIEPEGLVTKGPGSKAAGLATAFKLLEAAQDRRRAVNAPHLVALVRAGARFEKEVMVERPDEAEEVAA